MNNTYAGDNSGESTLTKLQYLASFGYVAGARDDRLNTKYKGRFMVAELGYQDEDLPTQDGRNGPWCIVGDDLTVLIEHAYEALYPLGV